MSDQNAKTEGGNSGCDRAFEDVRLLFNYVAREKAALSASHIEAFVALNQKISNDRALDPKEEQSLWGLLDQLSEQAHPVSAASLRTAENLSNHRRFFFRTSNPARSQPEVAINWAVRWVFIALLMVMATQIYSLVGTKVFLEIDRLELERRTILERIDDLRAAAIKPDDPRLRAIVGRYDDVDDRIKRNRSVIVEWNRPWLAVTRLPMVLGAAPAMADFSPDPATGDPDVDGETRQRVAAIASDHQGRIALQAIALFILPTLYGLLGACAFILRRLTQQVETATLSHVSLLQLRMRQVLGLVLGAIIGLFYSDPTALGGGQPAATGSVSLSLVALGFAAGYSVELTFSLIDGLIDRWGASLRQAASGEARARHPAPGATAGGATAGDKAGGRPEPAVA